MKFKSIFSIRKWVNLVLESKLSRTFSDKRYLRLNYWVRMKRKLDLENPKTFNEKLQWLKLYDRKPIYTTMVDKYEAKKYVADIIGEEHIVPTLGVWESFDEIDFDSLPNQFVLKCTHDSGGLVICRDKTALDMVAAKKKIERSLKRNYFWQSREWPYKELKPRIIAEKYMEDEETSELRDYKFFCFDGKPELLFIATARQSEVEETKFDFFDMDFNLLPFTNGHPNASVTPEKPRQFEKMQELAAKLSVGVPQLRVDFYEVNGAVYFGELTLFHWGGTMPFKPECWDAKLGSMIKLPDIKNKKEKV
ncbi:MAG: glycosyl transferase [Clostridia bacterium]|nr:glycosyl transferase [Clostridia bacterium]